MTAAVMVIVWSGAIPGGQGATISSPAATPIVIANAKKIPLKILSIALSLPEPLALCRYYRLAVRKPCWTLHLRSGTGIDGLQYVCSTAVSGELDWSPGVHEQCIGRVHRDGQAEPVMAYFLLSDSGRDPIVSDVLGVKREQIEGVRSPGEHLVERLDVGESKLRSLAQQFPQRQGVALQSTNVTSMETSR